MSQFVYINFYKTTLSAALTSTSTTMTVSSATGLPTLTTGQILPLVLTDAATQTVHEIVYVTSISSNTLTIERGQEGTAANTWGIGDYVACSTTAETVGVNSVTGNPYDISSGVSGPIAASQYVLFFVAPRAVNIPASFSNSQAKVLTAFTAAATYTIYHNGTSVGTISFAASGTVGTFSTATAFTLAVGDELTIQAPSTADSTAANLAITIEASLA